MRRSNLLLALLGVATLLASLWVWVGVDPDAAELGSAGVIEAPRDDGTGGLPVFASNARPAEPLATEPDQLTGDDLGGGAADDDVDRSDLSTLAVLAGRVTRAADGTPVVGITLEPLFSSHEVVAEMSQATTDADGRYTFALSESVRLHAMTVPATADTTRRRVDTNLQLSMGEVGTLDVELFPGATLVGIVVDGDTRPVPGATVFGWTGAQWKIDTRVGGPPPPDRTVTADSLGRFVIGGLGPYFVLSAEAPEMTCRWRLKGKLPDGSYTEGVTLSLSPARHAPGLVMGPRELPLGDVTVTAIIEWAGGANDVTGIEGVYRTGPAPSIEHTDGSGSFLLGPLADETYRVSAEHAQHPRWEGANSPGQPEMLIRLSRGATLGGRVISASGGPVADAQLRLGSTNEFASFGDGERVTRTDENGLFELVGLNADGLALLSVRAENHALHVEHPLVILEDGAEEIEIVLQPGRVLAGTVVDSNGLAVGGAFVVIEGDRIVDHGDVTMSPVPTWESRFWDLNRTRTDALGAFRFEQLYDGVFELVVTHPDDNNLVAKLAARSGAEDLEVVLDPDTLAGVTLIGNVRDALTGRPLEVFTITPMIPQGLGGMVGTGYVFDDAGGRFHITGLDPGPLLINAAADGYAPWSATLRDYTAGEHLLDVQLLATRVLHLRVVNAKREPVSAHLTFLDRDGRDMFVSSGMNSGTTRLSTDDNGEVVAMGLPADRITVRVEKGFFGSSQDYTLDLRNEPRGVQELVFGESGQTKLMLFVLTGEAPAGLSAPGATLENSLRLIYEALQSGSARPMDAVVEIVAKNGSGAAVAERRFDPGTPDPEMDIRVPGVPGAIVVLLDVPAAPLELTLSAPGYLTGRRAWQPDRSGVPDQVLVIFLAPE